VKNLFDYGGTAFPAEWKLPYGAIASCPGRTLRDYFAGQALSGILAGLCAAAVDDRGKAPRARDRVVFNDVAKDAYTIADAMLKAREASS